MFYQQMVHLSHTFYIKLFLEKHINVFTWNYRAYGRSKGKPTPENLKKDVECVYRYLREKLGLKGKIGIYGRSLGGIPSSYLSNKVDMAIVDRSFCNLAAMARWKYHSTFADYLFKIGSCGWQAQNDFYILRGKARTNEDVETGKPANSCYKVILQDRHDEIVEVQASLMVGVAKEVSEQQRRIRGPNWRGTMGILSATEIRTLVESLRSLLEIEEALYLLIQKSESVEFTRPRASKQKSLQGKQQQSQLSATSTSRQQPYLMKEEEKKEPGAMPFAKRGINQSEIDAMRAL